MPLYLIGLGLNDEYDITLQGMEKAMSCDFLYMENYTALMNTTKEKLGDSLGKEIRIVGREFVEDAKALLEQAKSHAVGLLVAGDPLAATTHMELVLEARKQGIAVEIFHNASVLTAVAQTGLQLYKFGKVTSIPLWEGSHRPTSFYDVLAENQGIGAHTLFLLDLKPEEGKFLRIPQALEMLEEAEKQHKKGLIKDTTLALACARLAAPGQLIKPGKISQLKKMDFGEGMQCLIIPGKLHFKEEEAIALWN
ncbi:diphthine synthase [Candidatus Woesearchaeota archaeon]|nr:diphthine synthase [Candidatus Woesearchaeota archaeon]